MFFLFLIFVCTNLLITQSDEFRPLHCNLLMTNPKKVINRYRNEVENYVQSKPFGSICVKCSMCLAIAKEIDVIFKEVVDYEKETKQAIVVALLGEKINSLCENRFDSYDLRKFGEFQVVTDVFTCNTHVRSKMDGQWGAKLREMCATYSEHMDVQSLLNDYLKGAHDLPNYLCNNTGIFRDCSSLNFKNTSIPAESEALRMC